MKNTFVIFLLLAYSLGSYSQNLPKGIEPDDPMVAKIDSLLKLSFIQKEIAAFKGRNDIPKDSIPAFSNEVYKQRIAQLDGKTPFEFEYNDDVQKYIDLFVKHRRTFTAICLGRSELYFPMYKEKLDSYGMPLELRYLSVIESALNPKANSRAGAKGLWQFMLRTGEAYGLAVDSYTDQRFDPEMATDAACRYLKFLHKMYGDWSMALAAYNAGPGNVNRAIRRSGGEMTYWKIRDYLPKETQGYVPTFIAVTYLMEFHKEHNIIPRKANVKIYEIDSVQFSSPLTLSDISEALDIEYDYLQHINPIYKTDYIPAFDTAKAHIYLPVEKVGLFMKNLDTLSKWKKDTTAEGFIAYPSIVYHTVKSGESMGLIADKYKVTTRELMVWNDKSSKMIHPGEKIKVHVATRKPVEKTAPKKTYSSNKGNGSSSGSGSSSGYVYYTIRSGDTLWDIANKKGVSLSQIERLNPGLNSRNLKVGQKIKIAKK